MPAYRVINEVRLALNIFDAASPAEAVRIARQTSRDEFEVGDTDRIEVYDEDGNDVDFDWQDVINDA